MFFNKQKNTTSSKSNKNIGLGDEVKTTKKSIYRIISDLLDDKNVADVLSLIFFLITAVWFYFLGIKLIVLVVAVFVWFYWVHLRQKQEPRSFELSMILLLSLFCLRIPYAKFLVNITQIPLVDQYYLEPVLVLVFLFNILFNNIEFSFLYLVFMSLLTSMRSGGGSDIFLHYFICGFVAVIMSTNIRKRNDLLKAGLVAGFVSSLTVLIFNQPQSYTETISVLLAGVLNGFISAMLATAFSSIFEHIFGQITNLSLLELSDNNQPLLRKLLAEAPGTHNHSMFVAHLAEAAADAVGANSLLARVGAYYHDIGKVSKAEYFSENQMSGAYRDRHKKLSPSMSTLIIMNHVKEGIELAKKYHLNKKIIDFIRQHHGTTLVYYFYAKAQQQTQDDSVVSAEEFRYPGPKPKTKETAIVLLADTIDARTRTLEEPSYTRIQEIIKESVMQKLLEGQLDETGLTLSDLDTVRDVFCKMISAKFHVRVEYPKLGKKDDSD